ncbi:MAG: hypothetical protein WDZ72_13145 [Cyclobacteriaceae bacterium]
MNDKKFTGNAKILIVIFTGLMVLTFSQWKGKAQNVARPIETEISFPIEINKKEVNFNLKPLGIRKFRVVLDQKQIQLTDIKVFDILGNLILQDKIKPEDGLQKNFDFSHTKSKLFVVEIGNSKYNKTKSIYAHPQGDREVSPLIQEQKNTRE